MSRTPNYVLTRQISDDLTAGCFVRPIKLEYLPKGWEERTQGSHWFNPETEVVCYTRFGLRIISRDAIREV